MAQYRIVCGNAFVNGVYSDFTTEAEAVKVAANYEGTCYRLEADGSATLVYQPAQEEGNHESE